MYINVSCGRLSTYKLAVQLLFYNIYFIKLTVERISSIRIVFSISLNPIKMKSKFILFITTAIMLFFFPLVNFAQLPYFGTVGHFVLYTPTGAVGNTGVSHIVGHVGTNAGAITGFGAPSTLVGHIDSGNAITAQCSTDLMVAYTDLNSRVPTSTTHTPAFGGGETLLPGVYSIAAAGSIAGELILNAQLNPNAIFIFKFGGAFTTGASSTITLLNNAMACNIFWVADGAISMAAGTTMKGTLIAHNGAIDMGAGGSLQGRMLSTTGAVSVYGVFVTIFPCAVLPVELLSFTGICNKQEVVVNWSTAAGTNNNYFTVERSNEGINWQVAGTVNGTGNSSVHTYTFTNKHPGKAISYYRLKQTDLNGIYKYGNIITVKQCVPDPVETLMFYPNPSGGKFDMLYSGYGTEVHSTQIFNSYGQKVYESKGFQSKLDLSGKTPGIYFVHVHLDSKTIKRKIVVNK